MEFICDKCNTKLEKSTSLLETGCAKCGSKVFKTIATTAKEILKSLRTVPQVTTKEVSEPEDKKYTIIPQVMVDDLNQKRKEELKEDNIPAVKLKDKGVYEVNIDSLFRNKKADPIVLSGKSGIYRVEFLPVNKKE